MKNIITVLIGVAVVYLGYTWLDASQYKEQLPNFEITNPPLTEQASAVNSSVMDGVYTVEQNETELNWTGRAPLKSHYGTVAADSGEVTILGSTISGFVNFDMQSISSEVGEDLNGHLKSADFFDVASYPMTRLEITGYSPEELRGNLTIKGITQPVVLPVLLGVQGDAVYIKGSFTLDRTLWEIEYNSGSIFSDLGDNIINDEIEFEIDLKASKNA
ncbi:MAG: YceI family protein [Candidatus Pacebacteria bacterium]|nr:YceI family protein [Candidatus Paceibacterota bacterium]